MEDSKKTKQQLLEELNQLRREVTRLKVVEAQCLELQDRMEMQDGQGVNDITEHKQLEKELLKFKLGIERSNDAIFMTNPDGTIIYVNDAFEKIYGFSREETLGQTPRILKSGLIPQEVYKNFWDTLLAGDVVAGEIINKTKDGRFLTIEGSNNPIFDESGIIIGFLTIHRDVTERRRAYEELRRLSRAVEQSASTVVITNTEGYIEYVNPRFVETTGYTIEEALGQHTRILKSGETSGEEYKAMWETIAAGGEWHGEFHNKKKNGELYWESATISPIKDEKGKITHFLAVKEEITEQKQAQEALAKRAAELEIVAKVSTATATILDTGELLQTMVDLTKHNFNLYHAHLYLLNEAGDTLNLVAGADDVGRKMVAQGWSIPFNREQSLVARAARTQESVIVNDVRQAPDWLPNPLLPDTRSELAVPMIIGDRLLGVLDVQASETDYFTDDDARTQSILAAQLVAALENARLFEQGQRRTLELEETSQFLNSIVDNIPLMISVKDAKELRFVRFNKIGEQLMGVNSQDIIGKNDYDFFPPDEADHLITKDREVLTNRKIVDIPEELIQTAHQGIRTLRTIKVPIYGADGKPTYLLGISEDITERKTADEQLHQTQEQLFEALEIANLAYWEFEVETQTFTFNDQFYSLFGTTAEQEGGYQMKAMDYAQKFVHPDDAPIVGEEIRRAIETDDPNLRRELEHRIIRADGSPGYISVRFRVEKDAQGQTVRTVGANQDITGRKEAEAEGERLLEEVQQSQELLRSVIDATPDWIFIKDQEHRYQMVNQGYANALHIAPEDFIGKNDLELGFPEELVKGNPEKGIRGFWADDRLVMDSGQMQVYPDDPATIDGVVHTFHTIKTPLRNADGQVWGVLAFARDITERQEAEQERERLLAEVQAAYRQYVRREWGQFLGEHHQGELHIEHQQADLPSEDSSSLLIDIQDKVFSDRETKVVSGKNGNEQTNQSAVVSPITLRGEVLGTVSLQDVDPNRKWTAEDIALVEAVSEQLALTLENLRLFDETQQRAQREAVTRQIADKIGQANTVEEILRTSVAELSKVMGVSRTFIDLDMDELTLSSQTVNEDEF